MIYNEANEVNYNTDWVRVNIKPPYTGLQTFNPLYFREDPGEMQQNVCLQNALLKFEQQWIIA